MDVLPIASHLGMALSVVLLCGCASGPDGDGEAPLPSQWSGVACIRDAACHDVMVAAHRGHHQEVPENSLAAIRAAAELGVEFVEVDVRHTADGVLVLMHDETVDRTTTGSGEVGSLSWEELRALELEEGDPADPEASVVPLFSDALRLARELAVTLYVDQKTDRWDLVLAEVQAGSYYDQALIRDDVAVLRQVVATDDRALVMPPIEDVAELDLALEEIPTLRIVEVGIASAPDEVSKYSCPTALIRCAKPSTHSSSLWRS